MEEDEDFVVPVQWVVGSASSQSELHPSSNVLDKAFDKPWLTHKPTDDAWLCLEPRPPSAFHRVEVGNAGSALLEMHGLREDVLGDAESDYELLLSAQQVMSVKDLMNNSNRNQVFIYDIDANHKLSPVAAQQRWRKIRVNCRQPFGTSEHRACIGLAYIYFTPCPCKSNSSTSTQFLTSKAKSGVTSTKRKLPSWLSSNQSTPDDELPENKPRGRPHRGVVKSDADEGSKRINPELGGSLNLESQAFKGKAVTVTMEPSAREGRVGDSNETGEERAIGSSLKRRSPDAKKTGSKESKKSKVDLSKEANSRTSRDEDQVLCLENKDGPERDFSKLLVRSFVALFGSCTSKKIMEGRVWSSRFLAYKIQKEDSFELKDLKWEHNIGRTGAQIAHSLCAHILTPQNLSRFKKMGDLSFPSFKSVQDWILECHKNRELVDFERFVLNKGRPWRLPDPAEKEVKRKKVNCGSVEAIRKWAREDLKLIIDWLLQQDAKPDPEELEFTAAQGILVCLEDTVESLTDNQGLSSITENWGFVPRAVKELAALEEGYVGTSLSTLREAERLKGIYDEVLNAFLASSKKSTNILEDQNKGNDEVDDDATEVMSDVDSQETVDYNSDDTTVLDSEAIVACTHKLMEKFARRK